MSTVDQKLDQLVDQINVYGDKVDFTVKHAFRRGILVGMAIATAVLAFGLYLASVIYV